MKKERERVIALTDLEFEIEKLVLSAGDRVVFRTDQWLNSTQCEELRARLKENLPDGVHAIIISGGASLEVIKAEEREP
jgi:hypothetical protein